MKSGLFLFCVLLYVHAIQPLVGVGLGYNETYWCSFITRDGKEWNTIYQKKQPDSPSFMVLLYASQDFLIATDHYHIYKSTDLGMNWKLVFRNSGITRFCNFLNSTYGYFAPQKSSRYFITTDAGETFSPYTIPRSSITHMVMTSEKSAYALTISGNELYLETTHDLINWNPRKIDGEYVDEGFLHLFGSELLYVTNDKEKGLLFHWKNSTSVTPFKANSQLNLGFSPPNRLVGRHQCQSFERCRFYYSEDLVSFHYATDDGWLSYARTVVGGNKMGFWLAFVDDDRTFHKIFIWFSIDGKKYTTQIINRDKGNCYPKSWKIIN